MCPHAMGQPSEDLAVPRPARPRLRSTVARLLIAVAAIGLMLAVEQWISGRHPVSALRRARAASHARDAEEWRSVPDRFRHYPATASPPPAYERFAFRPTGVLANPLRYDAAGQPWEYRWGAAHRWLGPADPVRSRAAIRDDFFALCLEKAAYHDRMAAKWARAARLPWLPVDPDSPGPPLVYEPPERSW